MNVISSSYYSAERKHGVCQGTLWRQPDSAVGQTSSTRRGSRASASTSSSSAAAAASSSAATVASMSSAAGVAFGVDKTCDYCVLVGARLDCYESRTAYQKGDAPLAVLHVVGSSAITSDTTGIAFRLVTNQGTHLHCQATSKACRDVWLAAFQAGLELSLQGGGAAWMMAKQRGEQRLVPPSPQSTIRRKPFGATKRYCISCGAVEGAMPPSSPAAGNSSALRGKNNNSSSSASSSASSSPTNSSTNQKTIGAAVAPLPHYGMECRVDLCSDCETAQGLVAHLEFYETALLAAQQEQEALEQARELVYQAVGAAADTTNNNNAPAAAAAAAATEKAAEDKPEETTAAAAAAATEETTPPASQDETPVTASTEEKEILPSEEGKAQEDKPEAEATAESAAGEGEAAAASTTGETVDAAPAASTATTDQPGGTTAQTTQQPATADSSNSPQSSESWSHVGSEGTGSTPSPPPGSWQSVEAAGTVPSSSSAAQQQQQWIHLPPTASSTKQLLQLLRDPVKFGALSRVSPFLESLSQELLEGRIGVPDFMEQLDEAAGKRQDAADGLAELKKQAFRVAGDMGSAMKLLLDSALPVRENILGGGDDKTAVLVCILDFLLDLCEEGELSTVGFFWPQLCHIHLRMLPPENAAQVARVDLMEDFLLTVASRYSIHLALELIWSHTADLEESIYSVACSVPCRRRRYAVLRLVCELESILFDFEGCWGGGSVSLGRMLAPTGHQVNLLKKQMEQIQELRKSKPIQLVRSTRLELLNAASLSSTQKAERLPPVEAAQEKLRVAKNADYFSCHLNFSRRLSDIAEKLHRMDLSQRAGALEDELNLLNVSGTMGGDPLNQVKENLVRVVRVPSTEGHVFRSKERTPVLLLMEVIDEGLEVAVSDDSTPVKTSEEEQEPHGSTSDVIVPAGTDDAETGGDAPASEPTAVVENESGATVDEALLARPASPTPSAPAVLEGAQDSRPSPIAGALKRFASEETYGGIDRESFSPKKDVEKMVNSAVVQQLQGIGLPDLKVALEEGAVQQEGGDDDGAPPVAEVSLESGDDHSEQDAPETPSSDAAQTPQASSAVSSPGEIRESRSKMSALGTTESGDATNTLAPTGDVRREVLNAIMMLGSQGNTIAAGTFFSLQRSLQELERKRATELMLSGDNAAAAHNEKAASSSETDPESNRDKLTALGISVKNDECTGAHSEEDEVMEAIRLLLIQNRVAQGKLSPADAAKVLQHVSLNKVASGNNLLQQGGEGTGEVDDEEIATVDAGDVDPRLVGCGPVPPAVLQALTLWKGGMVTNAELLELVKKDAAFIRHSVLLDAENVDKLNEDSDFWGRFAFGERWAEKKSRIASSSPQGALPGWDLMGVIVKSNDDLRQEAFVMQLITLCQEAFDLAGLELWVSPYRILATGRTTGVIEMVRNAMSFDALKKRPGYGKGGLREHLQRMTEFTADPGEAFRSAQLNFVRSLAAYSLMSYFFLFKDRHNGNLLLDTAGHVIHIDFGFVFGQAPGGSFSLEMSTPFKLTEEMLDVMGGLRSPLFSEFVTLFCCGFLALQSYRDTFLTIVEITCENSTFKCFEGKDTDETVSKLRERFCPDLGKEETVSFALDLIKQATTSYGTRQYDLFQYMSQGIAS